MDIICVLLTMTLQANSVVISPELLEMFEMSDKEDEQYDLVVFFL